MTILRKAALATIGSIMASCSLPQLSLEEMTGITVTENFICFSNRCKKLLPQEMRDRGFQYCDPPPALAEPADLFTLYQQKIRSTELCDGETDLDRLYFWNTLTAYVPYSEFTPSNNHLHMIDVGCGSAESAIPFTDYFKSYAQDVEYVGIDVNAMVIDGAKTLNRERLELQFLVADARDFLQFTELGKSWDVILIRHQEIEGNIDVWREIFQQSWEYLASEGIAIVTSYHCHEHLMMETIFREELKARVYVAGENVFSHPLEEGSRYIRDQYVAIFGK